VIFADKLLKKANIDIKARKRRILMSATIALKKRNWIKGISFLLRTMSVKMSCMNIKCAITVRLSRCGELSLNAKSARIMICVKVNRKINIVKCLS